MNHWRAPQRAEQQYYYDLVAMLRRYFAEPGERAQMLNAVEWLERYAWQAAQRMVTGLFVSNSRSWRQAARESMRGREIYTALQNEMRGPAGGRVRALISQNAELIRSLPVSVREKTAQMIANRAYEGERAETAEELVSHVSRAQARLIARTETSKATTALTRARSEDIGIDWYVWETSSDQRVRISHRKMQGILVSWNEPPSPERLIGLKSYGNYAAGDIFNCRCYPAPLLRLNQVGWPHRVYYGGRITVMTLTAFRRIANINQMEAA